MKAAAAPSLHEELELQQVPLTRARQKNLQAPVNVVRQKNLQAPENGRRGDPDDE